VIKKLKPLDLSESRAVVRRMIKQNQTIDNCKKELDYLYEAEMNIAVETRIIQLTDKMQVAQKLLDKDELRRVEALEKLIKGEPEVVYKFLSQNLLAGNVITYEFRQKLYETYHKYLHNSAKDHLFNYTTYCKVFSEFTSYSEKTLLVEQLLENAKLFLAAQPQDNVINCRMLFGSTLSENIYNLPQELVDKIEGMATMMMIAG
jgi:transcription elongation GreA/GreB family factor